jgi:hypothetical protein
LQCALVAAAGACGTDGRSRNLSRRQARPANSNRSNANQLKATVKTKERPDLRAARRPGRRRVSPKAGKTIMNTADQQLKQTRAGTDENERAAPTAKRDGADDAAGNVDKIRDILFGSQMRDYEKKFLRAEERLARETAELREEMKRRFAALEAFVKSECAALADQLKAEKGERVEADKELGRELKDSSRAWEKKISQMEEQSAKALRDLRESILEEAKRLTEEMERKHKELAGALDKEAQELRGTLTDRLALADLFAEVALRLKNEFKLPAKK